MIFEYQKKNKLRLLENLEEHKLFIVTAPVSSGREHVIKSLQNKENIILTVRPQAGSMSSIITAMNQQDKFISKIRVVEMETNLRINLTKWIPGLASILKFESKDLESKHKVLDKMIRKNALNKKIFIVIKDFANIDGESMNYINSLANRVNIDFSTNLFIVIIDEKNEIIGLSNENNYLKVPFDTINNGYDDFCYDMKNNNIILGNDEYNFIFKNLNGNIKKLVDIMSALSNKTLNFENSIDIGNKLEELLRTHEITGDSDIVQRILCYMALLEEKVGNNELATLLHKRVSDIEDKTEIAKKRHLINKIDDKWDFTLKILKDHFCKKTVNELLALNDDIAALYGTLYPSRYDLRAKYAHLANNEKYALYYTQNILQQIRRSGNYVLDKEDLKDKLKHYDNYIKFIYAYKAAKNCCMRDNYQGAVIELEKVDVHSELLIEKKLFISQCKIKSIALKDRQAALKMLQLNIPTDDDNLKYRLSTRRISAYVHLGDDDGAYIEYDKLLSAMNSKLEDTKSPETKYNINVVYRRCNNVLDSDIAMIKMEIAVEYFREHKDTYMHGYYIALCNYLGILIINYCLQDAMKISEGIENLVFENSNIVFPRTYIYDNDKILLDYFSKTIDSKTAEKRFAKLIKSESDNADNIFISSNYSIFLALNGKLDDALTALLGGANLLNNDEDQEGIYNYRVVINEAIYKFIMNNSAKEKEANLGKHLKENILNCMPKWKLNKLEKEKVEHVLRLFDNDTIVSAVEWEATFEDNLTDMKDMLNYFHKAFVYTTVFNWDDD